MSEEMYYTIITGASGGIGYELAQLFAENGHNIILVSRQTDKLTRLADALTERCRIKTLVLGLDLSQTRAAEEIFRRVGEKALAVDYLVNNAGFYVKGAFHDTDWDAEHKLIQLQCLNHTRLTKLFLPEMLKRGSGGILNVASTGSFVPGPYNAIYCAAKSFVLSLSEALAGEVAGSGVAVTALCPGGTYTGFQDFSKRKKSILFPVMTASRVAAAGYHAMMRGKSVVIPGAANKLQVFMMRFIPRHLVVKMTGSIAAE
jgi:short-subunit dehydrogenase